jgi:hypothetical protein
VPEAGHQLGERGDLVGPALIFTAIAWVAFTAGVRAGEFDVQYIGLRCSSITNTAVLTLRSA